MRKIVTSCICPPIPDRRFDWCAHYDGDEESGNIGRGSTEAEAIKDFVANYLDDADVSAIAAAPELLGSLRGILAFYEPGQTYLDTNAWKASEARARMAVAKAEPAFVRGL